MAKVYNSPRIPMEDCLGLFGMPSHYIYLHFHTISLVLDVPNEAIWLTLDILGDSIFAIDILLNFLTAYEIAQSTTKRFMREMLEKLQTITYIRDGLL